MTAQSELAAQFRRFADVECQRSPLYRTLAQAIADDPSLLALAAKATSTPIPNLFLASVHHLLLGGTPHDLSRYYPSLGGSFQEGAAVLPSFRSFCLSHGDQILDILRSRCVQTNEVGRAAILLPALGLVAQRAGQAPLALIEIGASAGLLLLFDRYAYDWGSGTLQGSATLQGAPESPVRLRCEARGEARPPLPATMPEVTMRWGIDLHPLDVADPESARWLQALVWPDQEERAQRLAAAITLAQYDPPSLVAGDALDVLPAILAQVPCETAPCLFHCHTLNQFPPEAQRRFFAVLASASRGRTLYRIGLEYAPGSPWPVMILQAFRDGSALEPEVLAIYQAHGDWIKWS